MKTMKNILLLALLSLVFSVPVHAAAGNTIVLDGSTTVGPLAKSFAARKALSIKPVISPPCRAQ